MTQHMSTRIVITIALILGLAAIGGCGGGGNGDGNPPATAAPATAAPGPPAPLGPVWTLERTAPENVGSAQADVDAILNHIYTDQAVQSAVLVKLGYVIGERYASGYSPASLGTSWSVAKSFYSAAIGVAIDEGWIASLDQKASDLLTEWQGTNKEDITIRNLLEMRGGLPGGAAIIAEADQTAYALASNLVNPPGTIFIYSNDTSQLWEPLLFRATGMRAHDYLTEKILRPIGVDMDEVGLWFDPTGVNPMTYCCIDMRADDFARFGLLYARGGEWNGSQLISSAFVHASLAPQSELYGLQWWVLNETFLGEPPPIVVSAALGFAGQKIYVWPEEDVVLVVFTKYEHFRNQGYVWSSINFPSTCEGRNACADSTGPEVPPYDEAQLINLLSDL